MQRILVVCGAGASSTFLVHWMRRLAAEEGLDVSVQAASVSGVQDRLADADVLLVGSHLEQSLPALQSAAAASGIRTALLPPLAFDAVGAATALQLALTPDSPPSPPFDPARERETSNG